MANCFYITTNDTVVVLDFSIQCTITFTLLMIIYNKKNKHIVQFQNIFTYTHKVNVLEEYINIYGHIAIKRLDPYIVRHLVVHSVELILVQQVENFETDLDLVEPVVLAVKLVVDVEW